MKKDPKKEKGYLETVSDKIGEIAVHYGFTVVKPPHILNEDISKSKQFREFDHYNDAEEKVALTRWYMNDRLDLEPQPVSIHFKKPLHGSLSRKRPGVESYGFEIMGSSRSTSEALIIKCTLSILEELGYKDLYVDINSIGDRESMNRFERELGNYLRKHAGTMNAKLKQEFKKNHYTTLRNASGEMKEFLKNAPEPVASLSDLARIHFKEVLESIEMFGTSYKIKSNVLSNKSYASYTVFEVRQLKGEGKEDGELLAFGYRYNHLAKKMGGKREIPTVGVTILVKKNQVPLKKILIKNIKKPRFYLVQLGGAAKLKVLNVIEMLRKNKIPVHHSITKDKITGQLNGAEYMKSTHVLIMGQKEAIENTVVVRDINTREQETVKIADLPDFLNNIDKKKKTLKSLK